MKDKMFEYERVDGGYIITRFSDDPNEDEVTIPAEFERRPVVEIGEAAFGLSRYLEKVSVPEGVRRIGKFAFHDCKCLRCVSLPTSLEELGRGAFAVCGELREVKLGSCPSFGEGVFNNDYKLPAELFLAGLVCSLDITQPLNENMLRNEISFANFVSKDEHEIAFTPWFRARRDVFALAAENDCFREIEAEPLDLFIEYSIRENLTELTAYLLDLKNRKFGFNGGDNFEL